MKIISLINKMLPKYAILVILLVIHLPAIENKKALNSGPWFGNIGNILRKSVDVFKKAMPMVDGVMTLLSIHDLLMGDSDDMQFKEMVQTQLTDISLKLDELMERVLDVQRKTGQIPQEVRINEDIGQLVGRIRDIDRWYNATIRFSSNMTQYNNVTLENAKNTFTGLHSGSVQYTLSKISDYVAPTTGETVKKSLLDDLTNLAQSNDDIRCGGGASFNQYLYNLYKLIITAEVKGQAIQIFGYYLQHKLNNVSTRIELRDALEDHQLRLINYYKEFKSYIDKASTKFRPCGPTSLIRGETYIEMERLYRAVFKIDSPALHGQGSRRGCSTINVDRFWSGHSAFICRRLYECWHLPVLEFCESNQKLYEAEETVGRYEWFKNKDGTLYGNQESCAGTVTSLAGYNRWGDTVPPSWCICKCEGTDAFATGSGIHVVSLRLSQSETFRNRVVTGLGFLRKGTVICIQIQQGTLIPGGEIKRGSEEWLDCDIDFKTYQASQLINTTTAYDRDVDYVVITERTNYVDLGDLTVGDDEVVTGVRFILSKSCGNGEHIKLQLQYRKFNFSTGELVSPDRFHSSSMCPTSRVPIVDTQSPLRQVAPMTQRVFPTWNSFVRFGYSSFRRDAGQTTVPFLDSQTIEPYPPVPLQGVGIFYKGASGYGGFLAFRIYTLNFGRCMEGMDLVNQLLSMEPSTMVDKLLEDYGAINSTAGAK